MAINYKSENKSDIFNDIVQPLGFEEHRRTGLSADELVAAFEFLYRASPPDDWNAWDYRQGLVRAACGVTDTETPDNLGRYQQNDHGSCPTLTRPHAEIVREAIMKQ